MLFSVREICDGEVMRVFSLRYAPPYSSDA